MKNLIVIIAMALSLSCASSEKLIDNLPDKAVVAAKRKSLEEGFRKLEKAIATLESERTKLIEGGLLSTVQIETSGEYLDKINSIMDKLGPWIKTGEGESPTKMELRNLLDNADYLLEFVDSVSGSNVPKSVNDSLDFFEAILGE